MHRNEQCDVPSCEEGIGFLTECGSDELLQQDYRGEINVTVSGRECQPWDSQTPHEHEYDAEFLDLFGLDSNTCRNP